MEALAFVFSVTLLLLPLAFISIRRSDAGAYNLPPGSFGWPIVGESIQFLFGTPEKFVGDRMVKYSPDIFKTRILGEKTVVICGAKGHKFLFTNDHKYFTAFRPHAMQRLFRSYKNNAAPAPVPPSSDESKMIRQPGFLKPEALMRYLTKMDSITQQQLEIHFAGKSTVQISPFSKTLTLALACQFFLGTDNSERISRLVQHFDELTAGMHSVTLNFPGTAFYRANQAAAFIRKELRSVITAKKQSMAAGTTPMRDLLSHMIAATDPSGNSMAEIEIADKIMGMLSAGYSTVATAITFVVKYVGLHPQVYDNIRSEQMEIATGKKEGEFLEWEDMNKMKYSWNVACESMRLVPPLQGTFREALIDFTYAGYTIPKGWKVYWSVSTTNKNSNYFKDPEKFNPSRFNEEILVQPYTNIPFGSGPRMCPGKEYARLAILTFMHNMVKQYRWEVIHPNEKIEGDMMPQPQKGLPIRLYPY